MAPSGVGFLYLSQKMQEQITPAYAGWLSVVDEWNLLDYNLTFRPDAGRYQTGTTSMVSIAGLHASLKHLKSIGYDTIKDKVYQNSGFFMQRLPQLKWITPQEERLGIATFEHPQAEELFNALTEQQVTPSLREKKFLRLSPHYYHSQAELEKTALILEKTLHTFKN